MEVARLRLTWLACLLLACAACGRVGVNLLPQDNPDSPDDGQGEAGAAGAADDSGVSGQSGEGAGTGAGTSGQGGDDADPSAGCGAEDDSTDTDGDGLIDCLDACNGVDDASYVPDASCGVGYCRSANTPSSCAGGVETACMPGAPLAADDATCDGVDDDCDGVGDEDYVETPTVCGVSVCAETGTLSCMNGVEVDSCLVGVGSEDSTCDGFDDDCDGTADEDYATTPASCGTGACAATGQLICSSNVEQNTCTPGTPAADDATCDGVNDDCDAGTDEEYAPTPTSCGAGACAATGQLMCSAGAPVDSCMPGTPAAGDATCDNVNDDCNAATDEDYVETATGCGVGACARTGQLVCSGGAEQDTCMAGTPGPNDASCNGVDDDCSGATDENYAPTPTVCGMGACSATGQLVCSGGMVLNTCTSGTPAPNDATCNGINDDCDGNIDENYAVTPTNCGVGACARTGQRICSGGMVQNTCAPGMPAANDATCNGVDDDCNAATDENYVAIASCGVGYCRTNNTPSRCMGGVETPCQPAAPLDSDDDTADGVDDDCDGAVDENACLSPRLTYSATGLHNITAPSGCTRATVRLWGAGGASGEGGGFWGNATGGQGGPGGYAERTFTGIAAATAIALRVGQGGQNCGTPGANVNTAYSGGMGATARSGNGTAGANGTEAGGNGAAPSSAGDGGRGFFGGGGGGGGGGPTWNPAGSAGGAGAASVLFVASTRLVAGGGGGGGGAGSTIASSGVTGGAGGSGCSGNGANGAGTAGGGGGGGGKCDGTTNQQGTGRNPHVPSGVTLPAAAAVGGNTTSACMAGGSGYAIIQWAP